MNTLTNHQFFILLDSEWDNVDVILILAFTYNKGQVYMAQFRYMTKKSP